MKQPDIKRVIEFHQLLLELRSVERMTRIPPENKIRENDVEHSYSLAMMAWFLGFNFPALSIDKLIRLALVHDMVEVLAGDTFAFGQAEELATKSAREAAAIEQLRQKWPDFPDMIELIEEYEAKQSEEAKFVYALDKLMPIIINYLGNGYIWKKHEVTFERFQSEKESKMPISPAVYDYYKQFVEILDNRPDLFHPTGQQR